MFRSGGKLAAAGVLVVLLVVPGLVFAAAPKPGGEYRDNKPNIILDVSANGKKIASAQIFTKCNLPPLSVFPTAIKNGRVSYSRAPKDFFGKKDDGTLTMSVRFPSANLAKGTLRYVDGKCDTGKMKFSAALKQ